MKKKVTTPIDEKQLEDLNVGDMVLITGTIYTARDAAHIKMLEDLKQGKKLPFSLEGTFIYYAGPSPTRPGNISGAFGPTTTGRMDHMTVPLLEKGLRAMIGKGKRRDFVQDAMKEKKAVYFAAIGGAGALISGSIKKIEIIAYEELGAEAIRRLEVENFPAIVAYDTKGCSIY